MSNLSINEAQKNTMISIEEQIFNQIKKAQNILITFGQDFNGDSISSSLALFLIIKKLNKKTKIAIDNFGQDNIFEKFKFLPGFNQISNNLKDSNKFIISLDVKNIKVENIKYELKNNKLNFIINPQNGSFSKKDVTSQPDINYDLIITLNTSNLNSLAKIYENNLDFFHSVPIINIDHSSHNENFGQINLVEITKSSVCEILFYILYKNYSDLIDEDIATCLLCGIILKTRNFKTLNMLPNTLASAAKLISLKARREEIVNHLYISRDINLMRALGNILSGLQSELNCKLVWFSLNDESISNVKNYNIKNIIFEAINELIINIPQIEVVVAFYNGQNNNQKSSNALVHSTKNINALDLVSKFEPIGTRTSAFIVTNKTPDETRNFVLDEVIKKLKSLID